MEKSHEKDLKLIKGRSKGFDMESQIPHKVVTSKGLGAQGPLLSTALVVRVS